MTNITPTTPPPEGNIDTQVIGHVLLIGINRPAKRNGWTPPARRGGPCAGALAWAAPIFEAAYSRCLG